MVFVDFSGSEAPKIHPKSCKCALEKSVEKKTAEKSILASVSASQNHPKCTKNRKKRSGDPLENESKKTSSATHRPGPHRDRKSSLLGSRQTIQPPFQWLVLLDLPLVALIIKVSPAKSISKRASFFEILPKNLQNRPTIYPKSPMIAPKLPPKSYWILERTPNAPRNRFFTIFDDFWTALGAPKSSSKRHHPEKSNWKSMFQKKTFFNIGG